jgi:hypothetical protein
LLYSKALHQVAPKISANADPHGSEAGGTVMQPIMVCPVVRTTMLFCRRGPESLSIWQIREDCADMEEHEGNLLTLVGGNLQGTLGGGWKGDYYSKEPCYY